MIIVKYIGRYGICRYGTLKSLPDKSVKRNDICHHCDYRHIGASTCPLGLRRK